MENLRKFLEGVEKLGATEQGIETLQDSIDFFRRILSGDPTATAQALAEVGDSRGTAGEKVGEKRWT